MSFVPPDQAPPDAQVDDPSLNGGDPAADLVDAPPQPSMVDDLVNDIGGALGSAAKQGAASNDPDAALKFAQAGFQWAQAIEKLMPEKPPAKDPNVTAQLEADVLKHGTDLAFREQQAEQDRQHKLELAKVQAQNRPSKSISVKRDGAGNMTGLDQEG